MALAATALLVLPCASFAADAADEKTEKKEEKLEKKEPADKKAADDDEKKDDTLDERTRRLGDRIKSVQRKAFIKHNRHELTINAGLSLNDAFYQQITLGAGYTYHITDHFGLEANFKYYLQPIRTDAVKIIRATESATPVPNYTPQLSLTGELQFSPLYGKISLMAEAIVHFDLYLGAGFGALMTEDRRPGDGSPWRAVGTAVIGLRVMTTSWLTIRAEIRDQFYQDAAPASASRQPESAVQNLLTFNLGVSFFLPPTFDYRYE